MRDTLENGLVMKPQQVIHKFGDFTAVLSESNRGFQTLPARFAILDLSIGEDGPTDGSAAASSDDNGAYTFFPAGQMMFLPPERAGSRLTLLFPQELADRVARDPEMFRNVVRDETDMILTFLGRGLSRVLSHTENSASRKRRAEQLAHAIVKRLNIVFSISHRRHQNRDIAERALCYLQMTNAPQVDLYTASQALETTPYRLAQAFSSVYGVGFGKGGADHSNATDSGQLGSRADAHRRMPMPRRNQSGTELN